jgi:hypothetical protein
MSSTHSFAEGHRMDGSLTPGRTAARFWLAELWTSSVPGTPRGPVRAAARSVA